MRSRMSAPIRRNISLWFLPGAGELPRSERDHDEHPLTDRCLDIPDLCCAWSNFYSKRDYHNRFDDHRTAITGDLYCPWSSSARWVGPSIQFTLEPGIVICARHLYEDKNCRPLEHSPGADSFSCPNFCLVFV